MSLGCLQLGTLLLLSLFMLGLESGSGLGLGAVVGILLQENSGLGLELD